MIRSRPGIGRGSINGPRRGGDLTKECHANRHYHSDHRLYHCRRSHARRGRTPSGGRGTLGRGCCSTRQCVVSATPGDRTTLHGCIGLRSCQECVILGYLASSPSPGVQGVAPALPEYPMYVGAALAGRPAKKGLATLHDQRPVPTNAPETGQEIATLWPVFLCPHFPLPFHIYLL